MTNSDLLSMEQRRLCMSRIGGKNTKPEILIRQMLFSLGFRYRLHHSGMPGTPDLVFKRYRAVIFVHGCFWHGHECRLFKWPKNNEAFWRKKIEANIHRDARNISRLASEGWRVMVIWECALRGKYRLPMESLSLNCAGWLTSEKPTGEISSLE